MMQEFWNDMEAASEAGGLAAVEERLAAVVAAARRHGLGGVVLDVLADTTAPEVVRWRALAHLTPSLMKLPEPQSEPSHTTETTLEMASC